MVLISYDWLKDFIDLRPIYHRKARRISAHIYICVLALLLERILQRKLRAAKIDSLSIREALTEMKRLRILKDKVNQVEVSRASALSTAQRRILGAIGVGAPEAIVKVQKKRSRKSLNNKK